MTENEAIWVLKDFDKQVTAKADGACQTTIGEMACKVAISALEEIQQYRALGTVEELQAAREKQKAKKILKRKCNRGCVGCNDYANRCPTCKETVDNNSMIEYPYCPNCGQALDWSWEK